MIHCVVPVLSTPLLDTIRSGALVPTRNQIVAATLELEPKLALSYYNGDQARLCATPIFTKYLAQDGREIPLVRSLKDTIGAGYVRVSTASQRSQKIDVEAELDVDFELNGLTRAEMRGKKLDTTYTESDQIERIVDHFLAKEEAFFIASDAGLSGGWPWYDVDLMRRLYCAKAERYHSIFSRLILSSPRYENQRAGAEAYLATRIEQIVASVAEIPPDWASRFLRPYRINRRARTRTIKYRPGLTFLVKAVPKLHTIATADLTRLFRSYDVQAQFGRYAEDHGRGCQILGTIEPLDFLNPTNKEEMERLGIDLTGYILGRIAEGHLNTVLVGSIRGQLGRLESGSPINCDATWLIRHDDGSYTMNPGVVPTVKRAVELYEMGYGPQRIMNVLLKEGFDEIPKSLNTMTRWFANPLLIGNQEVYGLIWQGVVPPVLIDEQGRGDTYRFAKLQERKENRNSNHPNRLGSHNEMNTRLGAGIARCVCGKGLHWKMNSLQPRTLKDGRVKSYSPNNVYVCYSSPSQLNAKPHRRVSLHEGNFHKFLNSLVFDNAEYIVRALEDSRERDTLYEEVALLEREVRDRRVIVDNMRRSDVFQRTARDKAEVAAQVVGITVDDEFVASMIERIIAPDEEDIKRRETRLEQARQALAAYALPTQFERVKNQMNRASELNDRERNELARALMSLQFDDSGGELICYLTWSVALKHPIHVPLQVTEDKRGHRTIRLPENIDWVFGLP